MKNKNNKLKEAYGAMYKYAVENPELIKPGTAVLDAKGKIRTIAEVFHKTLRLEGDSQWVHISEVRFSTEKEIERNKRGNNISR